MSFDKKIEDFYGFNPNKMIYDISDEKDKICFNSGNIIIQKSFLDSNNILFGESSGNTIKTIKFIKRGKYIITTEINGSENNLIILVYQIQNNIILYHKTKIDINEYSTLHNKNVFFDINSNLEFIICLLNENNEILIFKGKLEKDSLSIFCEYFCIINRLEMSIKLIKFIFEYNLLICTSKEKIISIKLNESNDNEANSFEIMNKISNDSFNYIPKSMKILMDNIEIKNNLIEEKNQIKIIILCTNGKSHIYSTELNLLKEISLNTIENSYNLDDEEENFDLIYNFSYLSISEGIIILGGEDSKIYIYDSISYNQKYTINISELNDKSIMSKISFIYINEKSDIIYIILFNGQIFSGKLSLILYKKPGSLKLLSYGHKNKIISLDISSYDNENNNNAFYTISQNGPLIKTYFNGSKFTNLIYNNEKIKFTTCKINPKYNNLLYAGDEMGNLYIFDIDNRKFELINIDKIANFKIDSISFSNNIKNDYLSIGFDSGMITIHDINIQDYKCDFILKVCDDFNNNFNKEKINSFCYFYEDNDNRICYLSKENSIMVGNLNSINNNIILMNEANYSYNISKFGYILDIKIHPSKKYIFILLSSYQIDVRNLDNINVRIGILDLFQYKKVNKIDFDISGDFMIYSNYDNLYIYNLRKNKVYKEINKLFDMSFCKFTNDGRYFILCGNNGSFCIMLNYNDIKNLIYNYKDAEIKYGIKKVREMFNLQLDDHLLKERNINKKKIIHPHEENKEQKIEKIKHSNTQQYFIDNNNFNFIQKKNLQKIHIMDDYKKTKDNFATNQFNNQNLYLSQNYQNQNIPLQQDFTYSNNNLIQSQRIPQNNINYNNTNQFIQNQRNLNYNNSNQLIQSERIPEKIYDINNSNNNLIRTFQSQRIYPNSNYITLNKDPSIFPINQKSTIKKINRNNYTNSNNMLYPTITSDIVETSSKQNQNDIRIKNISKAVFEMSKPNIEKERYQLIRNQRTNQEIFKKQSQVYSQNNDRFKNIIPKDSFKQNYNINNEEFKNINQKETFNNINNFNQNTSNKNFNSDFNNINNSNYNEKKQNNKNSNQDLKIRKNYTQNYKVDLEKFENESYYSRFTNNGSYYINNGIDNKKRNILPDDDSIDNIIEEVSNNSFENKNIQKKKSKINESYPSEQNSIKNKSSNSNSIKNEKNYENEKRNYISQFNKSNNDFSIHSFSKKDNNSAFDDIDNVEKDIKRFEIENRNYIK